MDVSEIKARLKEMYPEIGKYDMDMALREDEQTDTWILTLTYGEHSMETHLERQDVEGCLQGKECMHLGVQLGRFVQNYCLREGVCPTDVKKNPSHS
ncbi:MAG: hypothetical protein ACLFTB_06005 [Desulfovibrionales bacterium]